LFLQAQSGLSNIPNPEANNLQSLNRIAVAAIGNSENSEISTIVGRTPYYLIFDEGGVLLKAVIVVSDREWLIFF